MSENTFACLAGDGVGPELMAAATRALDRVARLHSLELADVHLPFAGEAMTRSGHPLPAETRSAYRDVDAILVSSQHEPAFEGVKADLQLAWRIARVQLGERTDVVVIAPMGAWADAIAVERAFACASTRRGRVAAVSTDETWFGLRRARAVALARHAGGAHRPGRGADPAEGVPRRDGRRRHRVAPARRARRRCIALRRLQAVRRARWMPDSGPASSRRARARPTIWRV